MTLLKNQHVPVRAYAYSSEEMLPNEGWVLDANMKIDAAIDEASAAVQSAGVAIRDAAGHVFQDSMGGITTSTAAAAAVYTNASVAGAVALERGAACFNCHVAQPIYNALSESVDE